MIIDELIKTITEYRMLNRGDTIVLGVSGGSDSVGLLLLLRELEDYDLKLIVAHLNHGIRGKEATRDENYVKALADKYDLKYEYKKTDVNNYASRYKLSTEEAARELRYEFLSEVAERENASKIATAHTIDDQAETVLMRMIRGSGPSGLAAIKPVMNNIIRPLINMERDKIRQFLHSRNIEWMEDSTNFSDMFLRNRVRKELAPLLKEYNPNIVSSLSNLSALARLESEYIESEAEKVAKKLFRDLEFSVVCPVGKYAGYHKAIRFELLRNCLKHLRGDLRKITFKQIDSADRIILSEKASGEIDFPGKIKIEKGYDFFCVAQNGWLSKNYSCDIDMPGNWKPYPGIELQIDKVDRSGIDIASDETTGYFSASKLRFPFRVTNFSPGDRFVPLGMKGYKKLKNLFIDCKIPRFFRKRIPVFRTGDEIFWIGGIRIDERYKVEDEDNEVIMIRIIKPVFRFRDLFQFS